MKPVVDRLEKQYKGKVDFKRIDVEKDKDGEALFKELGAQYVPTFFFFNADGTKADMVVGEVKESALRAKLDSLQ